MLELFTLLSTEFTLKDNLLVSRPVHLINSGFVRLFTVSHDER